MQIRRQLAVVGMLLAMVLCTRAQAQQANVMDNVPGDALVVFKVKNLDAVSKKVAKAAKDLGLDQMTPELADPLGSLEEQAHLGKGVNRAGDLAIAMSDPDKFGGNSDKAVLVVVPVSDYKAFLGNLTDTKDAGAGVTSGKSAEGEKVFVAHWGNYAALSQEKSLVEKKPTGMKLPGPTAKEVDSKDFIIFANIPAIKAKAIPQMQKGRDEVLKSMEADVGAAGGDAAKKFTPVLKAIVNQYFNGIQQFLEDAQGATLGMTLSDAGLSTTVLADFAPGSYFGKIANQVKNTNEGLISGLPDRKYFAYGGASCDPKLAQQVLGDILDPIVKELAQIPEAKSISTIVDAAKKAAGATHSASFGYVVPNGALGQDSIVQTVAVLRGDAATIHAAQLQELQSINELMKMVPKTPQGSAAFEVTPGGKTIAGVKLDAFEWKMKFDPNDAQAAQVQQMLAMIYGPNGQSGVLGVIDPKTVMMVGGGSEQLITDAIGAAKANTDLTAKEKGVQAVAAQLPKSRSLAFYIELDNILTTGIRYAKGFGLPVNVKLPADLPPIGITGGGEGDAMRLDSFIPMDLVKGLVAAGMDAQKQMKNGGGGV